MSLSNSSFRYLQPRGRRGRAHRGQYDDDRHGSVSPSGSHSQNGRPKGLVSGLVRGVAAGIGLASESYHNHQEKKKAQAATAAAGESSRSAENDGAQPQHHGSHQGEEYDSSDSDEHDGPVKVDPETSRDLEEAAWNLDAAQSQLEPPPDYATVMEQDIDAHTMAEGFVRNHMLPPGHYQKLPMPVILPQRRPGDRARGFIHAYAPLLQNVGIDQTTFMDFLKDLNLATAPSPWINAINLAAVAVQHVPEPITIAVSIAAQVTTQVSLQAHSRSKTNAFLNKVNVEFFRPLGLIAVIFTWKPSKPGEVVTQVTFDAAIDQAAQNVSGSGSEGSSGIRNKMQASHGTTNFEWPESAPLVFPTLDKLSATPEGRQAVEDAEKKQPNSMKRSMLFAMDYMDKRAQAQWANDHPESQLSQLGVKPEFHSRYADPNHPASSGSLFALLTGGAIGGGVSERRMGKRARRDARHERRTDRKEAKREERGPTVLGTVGPRAVVRGIKKFIHKVRSDIFRLLLFCVRFFLRLIQNIHESILLIFLKGCFVSHDHQPAIS